tara:strand:+ start:565 stop:1074 length:510 start_codon:yes stop_codon:yes gene_type:complete
MVKKIIGYGLLVIVIFFIAILKIPSTISPSVSKEIKANSIEVQALLSDIEKFRLWDPKSISDSTVSYMFLFDKNSPSLQVKDSLNNIIATYKVEKSTIEEVQISVDLVTVDLFLYTFKFNQLDSVTKVNWSMDFESNLMMSMLGAEKKLESMFSSGLDSFERLVSTNAN